VFDLLFSISIRKKENNRLNADTLQINAQILQILDQFRTIGKFQVLSLQICRMTTEEMTLSIT